MQFPDRRMRRLRRTPALRQLVAETSLSPPDLIAPLFVREGITQPEPIESLPGVVQHTQQSLVAEVGELQARGILAVIIFGVPAQKDPQGSAAYDPDGVAQVALRELRQSFGDDLVIMADLCIDEYTDHGHCGLLTPEGKVDNDATLEIYGRTACVQVEAGADIVAPSGMMDGQVAAIRSALDDQGHAETAILAYAAKYASGLYGPFREAVNVELPAGQDRRAYQQDWRNAREAVEEVRLDIAEGADMVMVKPAVTYLDVIARVRQEFDLPLGAYHVSGEYSLIKAAAANGWIDEQQVALEQLVAVKRAGADFVLTYFARDIAELL